MRREAVAKKALAGMLSADRSMAQRNAFVGWRETAQGLRQERVVEELRRELVIGRAKATLMTLVGMQDGLVLPTTFAGWREVLQDSRQEREVEALRLEMAKLKDLAFRPFTEPSQSLGAGGENSNLMF